MYISRLCYTETIVQPVSTCVSSGVTSAIPVLRHHLKRLGDRM